MKNTRLILTRIPLPAARQATIAALGLVLFLGTFMAPQRVQANPPGKMAYQGFLVDANGLALGMPVPKNYVVVFRIFDSAQGTNKLWAEQQTVTVDKGYFSVLLGEGGNVNDEPKPNLMAVFAHGATALRYIGITVKISAQPDLEIAPRLQMITSPYAFMAANAGALVDPNGTALVTTAPGVLTVNGTVSANNLLLTGQYQVPTAEESLRIVQGNVSTNWTTINSGAGFTLRTVASDGSSAPLGDRSYSVEFSTAFTAIPFVTHNLPPGSMMDIVVRPTGFNVLVNGSAWLGIGRSLFQNAFAYTNFTFFVIGPR